MTFFCFPAHLSPSEKGLLQKGEKKPAPFRREAKQF